MKAWIERFVLGDLAVYGLAVIVVVGEGVIDRRKGEMGIVLEQFVGSQPVQQGGHGHGSDRDSCFGQPRAASTGVRIADDMGMGHCEHAASVADSCLDGKLLRMLMGCFQNAMAARVSGEASFVKGHTGRAVVRVHVMDVFGEHELCPPGASVGASAF